MTTVVVLGTAWALLAAGVWAFLVRGARARDRGDQVAAEALGFDLSDDDVDLELSRIVAVEWPRWRPYDWERDG